MGTFHFVDDLALADCGIQIEATTLDDLFATAAAALADVMVDPATVRPTCTRRIALEAEARDLLLYDWLTELIVRKDRDREVYPVAEVRVRGAGPYRLDASVHGAPLDDGMALRNDPKAVTLHAFALEPVAGGWRARMVIDI